MTDTKTELEKYNKRGVELVHKLNFSGAIRVFTDAIKLDPKDFRIWNNIGVAFLFCVLFEEQRSHGRIFTIMSSKPVSDRTIVKDKNIIRTIVKDKNIIDGCLNPAYEAFKNSLRLMRNAAALNNMGICSFYINRSTTGSKELKLFEEATDLDKNNAAIWYNLGHVHRVMEQYVPAEKALRKALDLGETDERICRELGGVLFNLGQKKEAGGW